MYQRKRKDDFSKKIEQIIAGGRKKRPNNNNSRDSEGEQLLKLSFILLSFFLKETFTY